MNKVLFFQKYFSKIIDMKFRVFKMQKNNNLFILVHIMLFFYFFCNIYWKLEYAG